MDNELRNIIRQTAAQKNLTVTDSVLEHLDEYDDKWRSKVEGEWNTPLIQAVLADSAIKFAENRGSKEIIKGDAKDAILAWHPPGEPTECLGAGIKIMDESRKSDFADSLHPKIAAYVKDIGSGNSQTRTA